MLHPNALDEQLENLRTLQQSYDQIAGAAEAYNVGKTQLAQAITSKGVETSPTDTYPEMAKKVAQIPQETTIYEGTDSYGKQIGAGGSLWDLYQVLADMKTRFMGTGDYAALIVCEYYKGYPSLVLQGADGYYTCDGDYYDYASPNHVWHDDNNGKMNRWVAFLYRDDGARLDITNTSISPRSMYIGGHIGTIEYFVDGRLTDLVCGIEETDVLDNFNQKGFTQPFAAKNSFINIKNATGFSVPNSVFTYLHINNETELQVSTSIISTQSQYVVIDIDGGANVSANTRLLNISDLQANVVGIEIRGNVRLTGSYAMVVGGRGENTATANNLIFLYINDITSRGDFSQRLFDIGRSAANLIDVKVGALITDMSASAWNPTNVLADATKKAQLIENIKNHILARVSDATGGTQLVFAVSTNMYNNIASEQIEWQGETMSLADAFLTKNWLLAGA